MDRTSYITTIGVSIILLVGIVSVMMTPAMRRHSRQEGRQYASGESKSQILPTILVHEFEEHTNSIARAFSRAQVIPCASRTLKDIKTMTNVVLRQAVARHLAKEVLAINLTNENYHLRWKNIDAAIDVIPRVHDALKYAGAPDKERCEFLFDAIQHFKEGAMATLREPMIKPTKNDLWGGRGDRWAQTNCKASVNNIFEFSPCFLNNAVFRLAYPKLPPAEQEYFRNRFREVFGIEYVPDEPNRRAYLWGTKGTLWDGKGLEWRF